MPFALHLLQVDTLAAGQAVAQASPPGRGLIVVLVLLVLLLLAAGAALVVLRRRALQREKELRRYETAFDAAPEAFLLLTDDLTIMEANDAAAALFGQDVLRLQRTRLANWIETDEDEAHLAEVRKALLEWGKASFWSSVDVGGRRVHIDVRLRRATLSEGSLGVLALLYDITDYREEGRLFRTLHERMLQQMPIEVNVLSPQGEYLHISPSTLGDRHLHAWTIGKTDVEYGQRLGLHPEVALRRRAHRRQAVSTGRPVTFEEELELPNDERRVYQRTFNPVGEAKSIYAIISYGVDVTDAKRYEAEAEIAREEVEETRRLREAIMSNLSHEFRTPLTGMMGAAQILSYEVTGQGKELIDMVQRSSRRLMNTLNSLLDLAGLRAGEVDVHPRILDLKAEVESVVGGFREEAERKGLFFRTRFPNEEVWVRLDQGHLYRILQHLIDNAVKFTDGGGVVVEVQEEDEQALVRVMDTGVGIDETYLEALFDEFRQESLGVRRSHEGTGIGLAVSQGLAQQMGGTITAESEKGQGSTFVISFPCAFRVQRSGEIRRPRVLVIEPGAEDRRVAAFAMKSAAELHDVGHLEELGAEQQEPFQVVLKAVPGANADVAYLVRELRQHPATSRAALVALDSYPLPGNSERYLSEGFTAYVPKPLNRQVLLEAVAVACTADLPPHYEPAEG